MYHGNQSRVKIILSYQIVFTPPAEHTTATVLTVHKYFTEEQTLILFVYLYLLLRFKTLLLSFIYSHFALNT